MEIRWGSLIFGTVFILAALGLPFTAASIEIRDYFSTRDWRSASATIVSATTERSAGSNSFEPVVNYVYQVGGMDYQYQGDRLAIGISDKNHNMSLLNRIITAKNGNIPFNIYYDPDSPEESVIDRDMRWGKFTTLILTGILFSAFGLLIVFFSFSKKEPSKLRVSKLKSHVSHNHPNVENRQSHATTSQPIRSNAKLTSSVLTLFTMFWTVITILLTIVLISHVTSSNENPLLWIFIVVFPLVNLPLIAGSIQSSRQWKRFGSTELTMNPDPGSIGGHVGGKIAFNTSYDPDAVYLINLRCIHHSRGSRNMRESTRWEDQLQCLAKPSIDGCTVAFYFDVPDNLPQTDSENSSSYYSWELHISAKTNQGKLDRAFTIPVFKTGQLSTITQDVQNLPSERDEISTEDDLGVKRLGDTLTLYYPAGRYLGLGIVCLILATCCVGGGIYVLTDSPVISEAIGAFFSVAIGIPIALLGTLAVFHTLSVTIDNAGITTVRKIFGVSVLTRKMLRFQIHEVDSQITYSSDQRGSAKYGVVAKAQDGTIIMLAEDIESQIKAKKAVAFFRGELGIQDDSTSNGRVAHDSK